MSRRVTALVAVLALVLVGGAAWWLLRPGDDAVAATEESIAAVTVEVLDIEPTSYEPEPRADEPEPLGVVIRWRPDPGRDSHYLQVDVHEQAAGEDLGGCSEYYTCDEWEGEDGTFHLSWQEETPEEDPGILVFSYVTDGEVRQVVYAGEPLTGDPRDQDLPRSIDDFERLLTDDRFSTTTTQEMIDTELPGWPES
ncbi:hypothetical protein [Nocardioides sambongensis]|uniref:hypothetical protein n=1 Tax=Nocardioides sambongensis TaxID=2589074 RepID=UPI00112C9A42|nr:hypothetical protein [Nocardioides sambongensis]